MSESDCPLSDFEITAPSARLRGRALLPTGKTLARLLLFHGYGEHCGRYAHFMRWLAERGIATTTLDQRGHGRSEGRRGYVRKWDEYLEDLQSLLDHKPAGMSNAATPLFAMGHSHGGLILSIAGERGILARANVRGVILASPYLATRMRVPPVKRLLARAANRIVPWMKVPKGLQPRWLSSDPAMLAEDLDDPLLTRIATPRWYLTMKREQQRAVENAGEFTLPLLCLSGSADIIADPSTTAEFFRRSGSRDRSLYVYKNLAHELIREAGREAIFNDILGWIRAR